MSALNRLKTSLIGKSRDPHDSEAFHKVTLIAFFAWVGLGSDGLSSSCYGPAEVINALGGHIHLGIIVAIASVITIFIISSSYSQIIQLFPSGGGGYLVASKLLSPHFGMLSGSALLIDYVLTISVSISSGSDALFSLLPIEYNYLKFEFALLIVALLTLMNLRGVKESVLPLVPIFIVFVISHVFIILYAFVTHSYNITNIAAQTTFEFNRSVSQIGLLGVFLLLMHAYSMGAGTYTGIEAVSNGLPILREPKVRTAKKTMMYMAVSLSFMVVGLLVSYFLFNVGNMPGKTLNAVLFEKATAGWSPSFSYLFVIIILLSEAAILFVAAQTGFIDGPRVLSNMALDRWVPTKFSSLSDRLVTQNGILLMGAAAFLLVAFTRGSVTFLIVLYSINVFITFTLSQLGMVRHWWQERKNDRHWLRKIMINGIGTVLTASILVSVIIVKFNEGGWITLLITGGVVAVVLLIKRHYNQTYKLIKSIDEKLMILDQMDAEVFPKTSSAEPFNPNEKTAVLLVNGYSGIGIHSLLSIFRLFGTTFKNFVFIEVGLIDAGTFKGTAELDKLNAKVKSDVDRYVKFMQKHGFHAEGFSSTGLDVVKEVLKMVTPITKKYPRSVFFGGQVVFPKESFFTRHLHNYTVFAVQKELYQYGIQCVILPIKLWEEYKKLGDPAAV